MYIWLKIKRLKKFYALSLAEIWIIGTKQVRQKFMPQHNMVLGLKYFHSEGGIELIWCTNSNVSNLSLQQMLYSRMWNCLTKTIVNRSICIRFGSLKYNQWWRRHGTVYVKHTLNILTILVSLNTSPSMGQLFEWERIHFLCTI